MSENDPWKNWYQEPTPSDPASADRTVSMPQPSNRPSFEPTPGSGGGAGGGYRGRRRVGARWRVPGGGGGGGRAVATGGGSRWSSASSSCSSSPARPEPTSGSTGSWTDRSRCPRPPRP